MNEASLYQALRGHLATLRLTAAAEALLKQAADKLLANTVIENYRVDVLG